MVGGARDHPLTAGGTFAQGATDDLHLGHMYQQGAGYPQLHLPKSPMDSVPASVLNCTCSKLFTAEPFLHVPDCPHIPKTNLTMPALFSASALSPCRKPEKKQL